MVEVEIDFRLALKLLTIRQMQFATRQDFAPRSETEVPKSV